jgi:hypothetical protein
MVAVTVRRVFLLWVPQILLGNLMTLSEDVLRKEFIFIYLTHKQELVSSD